MNFRKDINGLRAIAVIAVVLYHFNDQYLPGGFVGVDIFFVISGFLMTGIIFRGLENNSFSISRFYRARARRIIPALALLLLVVLIFAYLLYFNRMLSKENISLIGKHALSSLFFISNHIYWGETGYFDAIAIEKWLLHTWSLSVEWQFYLIYPVVISIMIRVIRLDHIKHFLLFGGVIGFFLSVFAMHQWASASFYLLPARAWEMMFGGIAFLYPLNSRYISKKTCEIIGVLLIFLSFFYITDENSWPSYLTLFPVLGTFLIIQSQQASYITSNPAFQYVGKWSYSIYLWHWPLVVISSLNIPQLSMLNDVFVYLLITMIVGFLSYSFIEAKQNNKFNAMTIAIVSILSIYTYATHKPFNKEYFYKQFDQSKCLILNKFDHICRVYGNSKDIDFVLWGDSHGKNLAQFLGETEQYSFISISTSGCPPLYGVRRYDKVGSASVCNEKVNDMVFNELKNTLKPENLILASRWSLYNFGWIKNGKLQKANHFLCFDEDCENIDQSKSLSNWKQAYTQTVEVLSGMSNLIVFKGGPILKVRGGDYSGLEEEELTYEEHVTYQKETNTHIEKLSKKYRYSMIDHSIPLCASGICKVKSKGILLFKDDNHLTVEGWNSIKLHVIRRLDFMLDK